MWGFFRVNSIYSNYDQCHLHLTSSRREISLECVKKTLTESTMILCENLRPDDLLRDLKSKSAVKPDDVTRIKKEDTDTEKVDMLIEILIRSPVSSYVAFMGVLQKERSDLYRKVKAIEDKHSGKRQNELCKPKIFQILLVRNGL